MSNNILTWDWKYRIFFDEKLKLIIENFIACLKGEERDRYIKIKNYYLGFYSISILIDAINSDPSRAPEIIKRALDCKNQLIQTPFLLLPLLSEEIIALPINEEGKAQLNWLLKYSADQGSPINYVDACDLIFGDWFPAMRDEISKIDKLSKIDHGEKLTVENLTQLYTEFYKELVNNPLLKNKYGDCSIGLYDTSIEDGVGFAEWWDRELIDSTKDLLVLFTNPDSLNTNDLFYTIIHEMYPGHGHFYNNVTHTHHLVDHGAMSIIEGWATFVEWNSIESEYAKNCRNNALYFLKENAVSDMNERAAKNYQRKITQGYSEEEALRTTRYATQYIGFMEAYYYGAIWIELFLEKNNMLPRDFIAFLSNKNVGEFFATWEIK